MFFFCCWQLPSRGKSPQNMNGLSKEEQVWLTKFFRDVMLEHSAIYTLWGSKPITEIIIERHSKEEAQAYYESLSEQEKQECWIVEDYDLLKNWGRWQQIQHRFPSTRYLFFECEWRNTSDALFVYFIDILKAAMTITENYPLFQKVVGVDFDPVAVVFEMPNKESLFWNKISGNALLWGILFGFGKENAYAFHWKYMEHGKWT